MSPLEKWGRTKVGEKVATNLRAARALVANGWCQGSYEMGSRDNRRFCARGAANEAECSEIEFDALRAAIPNDRGGGLIGFNDAGDRTQAEVLALFDRAIAAIETTP